MLLCALIGDAWRAVGIQPMTDELDYFKALSLIRSCKAEVKRFLGGT